MKRRKFLTLAGIGSAFMAVASLKFFTTSFDNAAVALIKGELEFLKLDPEGVIKFVQEHAKNKNRSYKLTLKGYHFLGVSSSKSGKIHQLVSNYLLSTDFFLHKMDETRVVKYVGFYDPYIRPCTHPFSHIQYPEQT